MPIYQYECEECNEVTEKVRTFANRENPLECGCGGQCKVIVSKPARFQRSQQWNAKMGVTMPGEVD